MSSGNAKHSAMARDGTARPTAASQYKRGNEIRDFRSIETEGGGTLLSTLPREIPVAALHEAFPPESLTKGKRTPR